MRETYESFVVRKLGAMCRPTTAELRQWLNDPTTPTHLKNTIYAKLQHRK